MEAKSELFTAAGVKVRRVGSSIYVREDEWQEYLEFNEVRSASLVRSPHFPDILIALEVVLYVQARAVQGAS